MISRFKAIFGIRQTGCVSQARPFAQVGIFATLVVIALLPNAVLGQLRVGNKFVTAKVFGNSGLVSIVTTPGGYYDHGQGEQVLSFTNKSYLTLMINGYLYTNNEPSNFDFSSLPNFGGYLDYGTSTIIRDTIRTTWSVSAGDIIQDVYPVAFDFSGQIVLRWKFVNHYATPIPIQSQFLLDTKVARNDRAKILTRFGYRRLWSGYVDNNDNYKPIPPFYQAFENDVDSANSFNPGLVSQGTFINSDLGLIKPLSIEIGDWYSNLSGTPWGWQLPIPLTEYYDSGVLIVFPPTGVGSQGTVETGRTAYGTGQFETCTGELYALIYRPRTILANQTGTGYTPNPFDVEMYLFNTDRFTQASNATVTLTVGPHLHILDSSGAQLSTNTIRRPVDPTTIGLGSVSTIAWRIFADKDCDQDTSYLQFYSTSSLGDPSFNETCQVPLVLPCLDKDTLPPIAEPVVINGFNRSVGFHDDRPTDKGLRTIQTYGFNPASFRVTIDPFTPCTKSHTPVVVHIDQLDSTTGGCVTIAATDCANNVTTMQVCFPRYPLHPDTVPPRIVLISAAGSFDGSACNMKTDSLLAVDDTTYDVGLKSIAIADSSAKRNFDLAVPAFQAGVGREGFVLKVRDSLVDGCIRVRVTDRAGNFADTTICYCTIPDTHPPDLTVLHPTPYAWSVYTQDIQPYDRGIDTIDVSNRVNVILKKNGLPFEPARQLTRDRSNFDFVVEVADTTKFSAFCVRAKDLADSSSLSQTTHWWSSDTCLRRDTVPDVWAPNILLDPPPYTSPIAITVTVNDQHFYNGTSLIGWDRGIDSIWFTNVKGFTVPPTIYARCSPRDTVFQVSVTDPRSLDSIATLCIHVVDCAGNETDTCWYYPIKADDLPPQIQGLSCTRTQLDLVITDSTLYDRGLRHEVLDSAVNFDPFERFDNGVTVVAAPLTVTVPGKSSTGTLRAIDLYGSRAITTQEQDAHSANVPVAIWVQNFGFKPSTVAEQSSDIRIPVNFLPTDTFKIERKGITSYSFTFSLVGDPGFAYVGFDTTGTASNHFDIAETRNGNQFTLTGTTHDGLPLIQQDSPLVYVVIHARKDESTRRTVLTPVVVAGNSITLNNDRTDTVVGKSATAILPAPYGILGSGSIVAIGSCSPALTLGGTASVMALDPNSPNPFGGTTTLHFDVPTVDLVTLIVYDALGHEVARLVNTTLSPGSYSVEFNPVGLAKGVYVARLETSGHVISRPMTLVR